MTTKHPIFRIFLCQLFILAIAGGSRAATTDNGMPQPGVRPQAMGNAFVAVADDVNAIYYNPAGLALVEKNQVQVMHSDLYGLGIDYNYIAFTQGKYGVSWANYGAGEDFLLGGGDYSKDMYILAGAYQLDPATFLGASIKWLRGSYTAPSSLDTTRHTNGIVAESLNDEGYSVDIGVLHQVDEMTRVGLVVRDIVGQQKTVNSLRSTEEDQFEPRIIVGFSRRTNPDFMFSVELDDLGSDTIIHVGAEKKMQEELTVRAGLDDDVFTAGFSYAQSEWEFEYAFKNSISSGLDKTQRYGAIYRF